MGERDMVFTPLWIGTSWKMNKVRAEARAFAQALAADELARSEAVQLFVIPPFTAAAQVAEILTGTRVMVGVQNLHWADAGAWTLAEIGHNERRTYFGDTDETVAQKVAAALRHGMTPLVCVGDTRDEYDAGRTAEALDRQVRAAVSSIKPENATRVVIAYEPVWSIGEGGTPAEPAFADEQHARIKATLRDLTGRELRVLYGGSVNPDKCRALAAQPSIDGLFIGRSAWQAEGYLGIVRAVLSSQRTP
jgi:triosephosphate isomerase